MCGRYAIFGPHFRYREHFDVETWPDFGDHYNLPPSAWVPVIRQAPDGQRVADLLRWGLIPNWAKAPNIGAKLNNSEIVGDAFNKMVEAGWLLCDALTAGWQTRGQSSAR